MNIEMDREHYAKLLILVGLWRECSPAEMIQGYIDSTWEQLRDGIPMDLTLEEFRGVVEGLQELKV